LSLFLSIKAEQIRIAKNGMVSYCQKINQVRNFVCLDFTIFGHTKLITKPDIPYITSIYTKTSTDGLRQAYLPSTCNNEGVKPTEICIFCET